MSNLMLSRHGIWYYRKVYILPCGRRKELRKSLKTRSKKTAKQLVQRYLQDDAANLMLTTEPKRIPQKQRSSRKAEKPTDYKAQLQVYLKHKAESCCERELKTIKRYVNRYLSFTTNPLSKASAAKFLDELEVAAPTKNKHVKKIAAFFAWLSHRVDVDFKNPMEGLSIRHTKAAKDQREAYTLKQVQELIGLSTKLDEWKRWVVLLGCYTGMRANEICQLHRDDIQKVDGIWCIRIDNKHDFQRLKTQGSRRFVPIPLQLEDFVSYALSLSGRLFPTTVFMGNCAHYFTKWFNRWRRQFKLPVFHSLRHFIATHLKNGGVPEQYTASLLGHSSRSITYGRYGKAVSVEVLHEALSPYLAEIDNSCLSPS